MSVENRPEKKYQGIPASGGVAHGQVYLFVPRELEVPQYEVDAAERDAEVSRFEQALLETRKQVMEVQREVSTRLGEEEASIFDAHLLVLEDTALIDETIREFDSSHRNIAWCFHTVANRYIEAFKRIDDEYLKERASDIRDVSKRLLQNLLQASQSNILGMVKERIIVAPDISPSDCASLEKGKVLGLVANTGSKTSHAVIMARSIQIPAVVGIRDFTDQVDNGDWLLIDGYDGVVVVNPSEETLFKYGKVQEEKRALEKKILERSQESATTLDGHQISLMANIEGAADVDRIFSFGADGVGLFRTEYLFLHSDRYPSENYQYEEYRKVAEAAGDRPVIIRTLDLGGDKFPESSALNTQEANPFLGFRAIRLCLENTSLFKDQLRAILRASVHGNIKMMYPMISGLDELTRANELLEEAREDLRARGEPFREDLKVGSMIEIPSAAMTADILARNCDFFSIGTNDLIQYLLAVDRVNDRISHLYEPTHPAVLRTIAHVVEKAHAEGIKVSVCGEIASDPVIVPILLGLNVDELSVVGSGVPMVKYIIRQVNIEECRTLARELLDISDPKEIFAKAEAFHRDRLSVLLP
ncbi:MAG: phosphoenolpyruvate--protein phosphotransferase [Opitutales bacterium]|nr:phosphoenolpyruvate--protein phosphotransferase [Opitutales bacterium]